MSRTAQRKTFRSLVAIGAAVVGAVVITAATFVADASQPVNEVSSEPRLGSAPHRPLASPPKASSLEITLVARDMAFYLPGASAPNPRLVVPAEEKVRLTMVNHDAGIDHDVAVESLGLASPVVHGDGSSTTLEFRAPREPGEHEYMCRLHGRMMRGTLVVR